MKKTSLKIHIIYKKKEGWELANLVYDSLLKNGFDCSIDTKDHRKYQKKIFDSKVKPAIDEADIILIIFSRHTLHRFLSKDSDSVWFNKKITYAISQMTNPSGKKKIIIPIIDDATFKKPKDVKFPSQIEFLSSCNTIFTNEKFYKNSLAYLYQFIVEQEFKSLLKVEGLDTDRINATDDYKHTDRAPTYIKKRAQELKKEKILGYEDDIRIFRELIDTSKPVNILDLGCGTGQYIYNILGKDVKVDQYVGIDNDEFNVMVGKEMYKGQENFRFFKLDLTKANDCKSAFRKCITRSDIFHRIKFDVVIINKLLKFVKYPKPIVALARDMLKEGGTILIGEVDDGMHLCYPDVNGDFAYFFKLMQECSIYGNPNTGKEVYEYLKETGFKDIKLHTLLDPNFDAKDPTTGGGIKVDWRNKESLTYLFQSQLIVLTLRYNKLVFENKNNKKINLAYNWLLKNSQNLINQLKSKDFYVIFSHMLWSGKK